VATEAQAQSVIKNVNKNLKSVVLGTKKSGVTFTHSVKFKGCEVCFEHDSYKQIPNFDIGSFIDFNSAVAQEKYESDSSIEDKATLMELKKLRYISYDGKIIVPDRSWLVLTNVLKQILPLYRRDNMKQDTSPKAICC
jgi:hypothetical protein